MTLDHHGIMPLTEENILDKPLRELDFGPFTHPFSVTWAGDWHREMITHLAASIKSFEERRILVISFLLTVLIGIFGNLFASSLFGRIEYSSWPPALFFLVATVCSAGLLFLYFPPAFEHSFQIFYGRNAVDVRQPLFQKFGFLENDDKLADFFRIHHLLLVRDCLRKHAPQLCKVTDVIVDKFGYETWVTVHLRSKTSWLRESIRKKLWDELGLLCDAFGTTILPISYLDQDTPRERVRTFDESLGRMDLQDLQSKVRQQILRSALGPSYLDS
jgi:hypothetical protein